MSICNSQVSSLGHKEEEGRVPIFISLHKLAISESSWFSLLSNDQLVTKLQTLVPPLQLVHCWHARSMGYPYTTSPLVLNDFHIILSFFPTWEIHDICSHAVPCNDGLIVSSVIVIKCNIWLSLASSQALILITWHDCTTTKCGCNSLVLVH
jgi:hypothetical protein